MNRPTGLATLKKERKKVKSLSHIWLFATLWTVACWTPPSVGFSRQEYWSGLPFPSPGDIPDPGIEPASPTLQADSLLSEPPRKPGPCLIGSYRGSPFCCFSVTKMCPPLCEPMNCSMTDFPVLHYLLQFAQTHVHWVGDATRPSHPLSPPSPPALSLSQHQGLFQWVSCSRQVAKVLELQLQHQSFQWIFRVDFL